MARKDRDARLQAEATEIAQNLNGWAIHNDILNAGEVIVYDARVEKISVVRPAERPMATEEFSIKGRKDRGVEFVRPARMTSDQVQRLLSKLTLSSREFMQELLVEKRNNPTNINEFGNANDHLGHFRGVVNGVFRNCTIGGKHYRLATDRRAIQLWEVKQIKK